MCLKNHKRHLKLRRFFFTVYSILFSFSGFTQTPKGFEVTSSQETSIRGKTYALIIGISKYQSFTSLEYADRDATVFYDFLRSKAGGSIDSANIFFRTNQKAKAGDIWTGMSWLERRADSTGETAIIFFSGHGDAANAAEAYLLAHDAPNEGDANMYNMGGTFQVYNLKNKIKQMVAKGVRVLLITDACRTNDLPGKDNGAKWAFQSITEEKAGEIQMTSCSGNEYSLEDKKWGNGRGVFSYWLLNGLSGLADNDPEDGNVTLYELERYVKDHVRSDTRSASTNKPLQTPIFCCSDKSDFILAKVDPETKTLVQKAISNKGDDMGYAFAGRKKGNLFPDSARQKLYEQFLRALGKKELIAPDGRAAKDYLHQLLSLVGDEQTKNDLTDQFAGELINEAQLRVTKYSNPPDEEVNSVQNFLFFREGQLLLEWAMKYVGQNAELMKELRIRKYFLEARSLTKTAESRLLGLKKIDSSLSLRETAYGWQTKGIILGEDRKYKEAMECFEKALELNNNWAFALNNKSTIFWRLMNYDSSFYYASKAISISPGYASGWNNLGLFYSNKKKYDSAKACYMKVLYLNPEHVNGWNNLGTVYNAAKQYDSAKFCYRKALSIDSLYERGWANLAKQFEIGKNPDSAIYCYEKAIMINPLNADALNNLGNLFYGARMMEKAKLQYQKVLAVNPDYESAWANLGNVYSQLSEWDEAKRHYKKALNINPGYEHAWFMLGVMYSNTGQYDSVKTCFLSARRSSYSIYDPGWYTQGVFFEGNKQPEIARICFRFAVSVDPGNDNAWQGLGLNYWASANYDSAKICFQKQIAINPSKEISWHNLGAAYHVLKQADSARVCFKKALELNPRYDRSWEELGKLYESEKQFEQAKLCYQSLVDLKPGSENAWYRLGTANLILGLNDSAMTCYRKALEINLRSEHNWNNIGAVFDRMGKYDSAIYYYEKALAINPKYERATNNMSITFRNWAEKLFSSQSFEEAIIYYKKAVDLFPNDNKLIYKIACCYSLLEKKPDALYYLEEALKNGYNDFPGMEGDKSLDWIRQNNEFKDLLLKYKK